MNDNPLKTPILEILKEATEKLSEYDLIKRLGESNKSFGEKGDKSNIILFRKHFMVMNALYQLQESLFKEGIYLAISALSIKLEPIKAHHNKSPTDCSDAKLRAYYLDWSQLTATTEADVDALLNSFWEHYAAHDKQSQALNTLGLGNNETWPVIQQTYRKLAAEFHPDRGGETEQFIAIRKAYETLRLNQTLYNQK